MNVPLLISRLLPVPHGFSTRQGGVSSGIFESLNLSFDVGDDAKCVEENLRRLAHSGGMEPSQLHTVTQIHGDRVVSCHQVAAGLGAQFPVSEGQADALWTQLRGHGVAVRTADCVPVLLVDPIGQRVAAVHSGWKGTELRIVARAVEAWVQAGADSSSLLAAIGPAIGPCCYEVSPDLAARFQRIFGQEVVRHHDTQPHVDLPLAVFKTLEESGVPADRIDALQRCTHCDPELFFSHRRSRGHAGRHMSFVVCRF